MGGRKCVGVFGNYAGDNLAGKGIRPWRFLPSQEWSTCVREIGGEFWRQCGRQLAAADNNAVFRPQFHRPTQDHSCVGRNLTVSCPTIRQNPPQSPHSPRKSFLRQQESRKHLPPTAASQAATMRTTTMPKITNKPPYTSRPFLRKQESHSHGRHRRLNYAAVGGTRL